MNRKTQRIVVAMIIGFFIGLLPFKLKLVKAVELKPHLLTIILLGLLFGIMTVRLLIKANKKL